MDLHVITQAVDAHLGQIVEPRELRHRKLEHIGKITSLIGISTLVLLAVAAFICLSISKIAGISFESFGFDFFAPIVFTVSMCLTVTGAALAGYRTIAKELRSSPRANLKGDSKTRTQLSKPDDAQGLESITERTTKLIE
jgi:hypothetical protein